MEEIITGMTAEIYRAVVNDVDERVREIRVMRKEFDELKGLAGELALMQTEFAQA